MAKSDTKELRVPHLPMRYPKADSPAGLDDFESMEDFLEELMAHAYYVAGLWAISFWRANENVFSVSSFCPEDIVSHLIHTVFLEKYRDKIANVPKARLALAQAIEQPYDGVNWLAWRSLHKNAVQLFSEKDAASRSLVKDCNEFTIKGFRSSFYVACHNACRILRRFLLAKKRRMTDDSTVSLDDEDVHLDHQEFPTDSGITAVWAERISGSSPLVTRMSLLAMHGAYNTTSSLVQRFKYAPIMTSQKDLLKAMVSRAKLAGTIQSPRDPLHKLVDGLQEDQIPLVIEWLNNLLRGNISAFRPPTPADASARVENVKAGSAFWLALDFEVLSSYFGIVLNHEVNPLIVWKVLRPKVEAMDQDTWKEVPDHIKSIVQAIRELADGRQDLRVYSGEMTTTPRVKVRAVSVQCELDHISISFGSVKPSDAFATLNSSPVWPNFLALIGSSEVQVSATSLTIYSDRARYIPSKAIESRLFMVLSCP
jgi:hypothetical protein